MCRGRLWIHGHSTDGIDAGPMLGTL